MAEIKREPEERIHRRQNSINLNIQQMSVRSGNIINMNGHARFLRTRGYRHNHEQKLYLVDFMEAHPEFAFGRYSGPRQKSQALWIQLTQEMNARGPKKTVAQWQKAWTDVKSRARARVGCKSNNPGFDPVNDLDARVLALLDSVNEFSSSKRTEYVPCDTADKEDDTATNQPIFFNSLQADILAPEMVLLPENDADPETIESEPLECSVADVKDVLETNDHHHLDLDNAPPDDENSSFDTRDSGQNFDLNDNYDDALDTEQNFDESSSYNIRETRQNYFRKYGYSNLRNRFRKLPHRNDNVRPTTTQVPSIQRRQIETLEAISKSMQQNAENEIERNKLMTQSLEISKARLETERERNTLLRELVSAVKGMSQDKNEAVC